VKRYQAKIGSMDLATLVKALTVQKRVEANLNASVLLCDVM